jgi:hypothetical protein
MADRKIEELDGVIERAIQMKQLLGSSFQCSCSTIAECDEFVARRRGEQPISPSQTIML